MHTSVDKTPYISFPHLYCPETIAEEIKIPSVFTSYYAAQNLKNLMMPEEG